MPLPLHEIPVRAVRRGAIVALLSIAAILALASSDISGSKVPAPALAEPTATLLSVTPDATSPSVVAATSLSAGSTAGATLPSAPDQPSPSAAGSPSPSTAAPQPTRRQPTPGNKTPPPLTLHVPILWYHRTVPSSEAGDSLAHLVVSPELFSAQLDALAGAGWHTITLAQLGDLLQAGRRPGAKTVVITIDDGWYDGYTYALPILQSHGFVATYFVVPGRVGNGQELSESQMRALQAAGNEIGNHGLNHVRLTTSGVDLQREISGGSDAIARITGRRPRSFAYPYGASNAKVEAAVKACKGLQTAVKGQGKSRESWAGRFEILRFGIGPTTSPDGLMSLIAGS